MRPRIGSAAAVSAAPMTSPMPMPTSDISPTWVKKWTMMREPVAPRLRSVAIERCRSLI